MISCRMYVVPSVGAYTTYIRYVYVSVERAAALVQLRE